MRGAGLARRMAPVFSVWGDDEGAWSKEAVVLWGGDVRGSGLACLAGDAEHGRDREAGRAPERWRAPVEPRVKGEGGLPLVAAAASAGGATAAGGYGEEERVGRRRRRVRRAGLQAAAGCRSPRALTSLTDSLLWPPNVPRLCGRGRTPSHWLGCSPRPPHRPRTPQRAAAQLFIDNLARHADLPRLLLNLRLTR